MEDFTHVMKGRTDDQLIAVVTVDRGHYRSEALNAAEEELRHRSIDPERYRIVETELRTRQDLLDAKAQLALPRIFKVLAFLFPGVIILFAVLFLKANGYDRQYQELGRWSIYGVGFYTVLFLIANC